MDGVVNEDVDVNVELKLNWDVELDGVVDEDIDVNVELKLVGDGDVLEFVVELLATIV